MEYIMIDKSLSTPLHLQLAQSIRTAIQNGVLHTNAKLPTEAELGKVFSLSRPVVRQAYKQLSEERLIYRQKAKGSFVLPKVEHFNLLKALLPLTEKISTSEVSENILELEHSIIPYNIKTMSQLELSKSDSVHMTKRLYYGEKRSMFYMEIIQPLEYYPRERLNINVDVDTKKIHRNIFAVKLDSKVCHIFNIPEDSAGFKIVSTTHSKTNKVIELNTTYVQGYNISIILDYFRYI